MTVGHDHDFGVGVALRSSSDAAQPRIERRAVARHAQGSLEALRERLRKAERGGRALAFLGGVLHHDRADVAAAAATEARR